MKHSNKTIGYICTIVSVLIVAFTIFIPSAEAAVEFMTSWHTRTYVPAWYAGKALPTYQSPIDVAFELIEDGKVANLATSSVRWYVDGKLIKNETNGLGIRKVIVFNKKYGGDVLNIKIVLPDYKGRPLEKIFDIPVKSPEVVIDVPYFQKKVEKGDNTFYAWPFYFNTTSNEALSLRWKVNGNALETGRANDPVLVMTIGNDAKTGAKYTLEATMINKGKLLENITKKMFVDIL
ncbi:MAG: hypothetical protein ACD_81C00067G0002 [uncultured bacterium]|uniref:Uncharacterized protein n=2 Tax=Candidatus Wolfeibacteriota TaxID=1752735 RepID=A0A0G1JFU6_9BACT|nr:MAG: hypothetical protein ACD_81C00067G0002 [uncultured bacterium]KKR12083.1 MAG: hypothetical protein UT41_C0003G0010 [Candidatus Wolfebacteria bacterium GW2011_GWC2_39_22]KKT42907.1 MAG: hypothetical protein UW32_C0003G0010 [Candidatus Wolfebacteria bacterium GW2011_GWE2_44_13]HBI25312.1 hypothetical protein [Candidatus Wolfebacteria bacterium]